MFLALLSITCASRAPAVVMTPLEIAELTDRAQVVVLGTVLSKTCVRDDTGRIFTRVELQVSEVWKGSVASKVLSVVHGGGTLGERQSVVSGQVDYAIGEEVAGFFVLNQRGEAVTIGLAQGKFRVWKDARTGEKLAANPFHGHAPGALQQQGLASAGASAGLTLTQLKQRVQGTTR